MKKIQRTTREAILYLTGKILTLCGITAALSSCLVMYGPGPTPRPDYWSDQAPEQVEPLTKTNTKTKNHNEQQYEQDPEISTEDDSADRR